MPNKEVEFDPRAMRRGLDLNQQEFWSAVGVTQSGGSRYEQDRRIPRPVMELLRLRYQLGIRLEDITAQNASMIRAITEGHLDTGTLKKQLEKIQRVIQSSQQLASSASELSAAAEAVLEERVG
ncbi:helix-turn-helix domain-containing protein [Paludibacterium yongneupense]|uniref:helix-turn-helix domain-containing protein n=1 Tax=Paludibacterium yongneupense TaxID=400061 RepID=UPI00041197A6|nr:transcriptional regulator [Paludibacterium yongneupense]